ncbi:MAG: hypothetical protein ACRCYY_13950 [Trueperaceae bacterium]
MSQVTTKSYVTTPLRLESYLKTIQQSDLALEWLERLEAFKATEACAPVSSLLASYLVTDLYSEQSSDEANINRITTNLEAAAEDLIMISKLIRALGHA